MGRVISKDERQRLENFEVVLNAESQQTEPVIGRTYTEYYANSKRMGQIYEKDGGYWDSNVELTARAFAIYIMDKLPHRSDYLMGHAECAINFDTDKDGNLTILKAYPEGEERAAINAVFDEIVADLKLQQVFTHDDRPVPELPARPSHDFDASPQFGEQLTFADSGPVKPSVLKHLAENRPDSKNEDGPEKPDKSRSDPEL